MGPLCHLTLRWRSVGMLVFLPLCWDSGQESRSAPCSQVSVTSRVPGSVCHPSLVTIGRASGGSDPARVAVQAVGWLTENTDHGSVAGRTVLRPGRTDTNKPRLLTLKSLQARKRARRPCLTQEVLLKAACCRWAQLALSRLVALLRDSPLDASRTSVSLHVSVTCCVLYFTV